MSPDQPSVTDAPRRFGEGSGSEEPPGPGATPAGPPKVREPASTPLVGRDAADGPPADLVSGERLGRVDAALARARARAGVAAAEAAAPAEPAPPDVPDEPIGVPAPPERPLRVESADPGRRERKQQARRRARKVKRIVRRLDAWSVMKVSFIFYLCMYVVTMVAFVVIWNVADRAGAIENVEGFIESVGFESFEFVPDQLFEATALGGAILAVLATGLTALGAVLFNLISDLVGGIRLTVIEEPGAAPARRRRPVGSDATDLATVSGPPGDEPERRGYSSVG